MIVILVLNQEACFSAGIPVATHPHDEISSRNEKITWDSEVTLQEFPAGVGKWLYKFKWESRSTGSPRAVGGGGRLRISVTNIRWSVCFRKLSSWTLGVTNQEQNLPLGSTPMRWYAGSYLSVCLPFSLGTVLFFAFSSCPGLAWAWLYMVGVWETTSWALDGKHCSDTIAHRRK